MEKKTFFHIGYSKAASTWIQGVFSQSPGLVYSHKPSLFKSKEKASGWDKTKLLELINSHHNAEKPFLISHEHLILPDIHPVLQCSTTSLDSVKGVAKFLTQESSSPYLIIIIRRQVDIIASRYLQYLLQGGSLTVDEFLAELLPAGNPAPFCEYRFSLVIRELENIIGKSKLLVVTVDEIKKDPIEVLGKVSSFIGCQLRLQDNVGKKTNVGLSKYGAKIIRIWNKILVKEKETSLFPTKTKIPYMAWLVPLVFVRKVDNFIFQKKKRPSVLSVREKQRIHETFLEDNMVLASQLKNIDHWLQA